MKTGKAALYVGPSRFELTELPVPPVEAGGILVKVRSAGICGSDLHYWRGHLKPENWTGGDPGPTILGHEMAGAVDTLGAGVSTDSMGRLLREGDRVAFAYFFPCGRCYNCLRGQLNACPNRTRFRMSVDRYPYCSGGYSEYFYLHPGHFVFKVPDELPDESVAPANCAVSQVIYALRRADLRMGDSVVIQGAGGLGINATAAAKEMGAGQVIVVDGVPERLVLASQCGADATIDINEFPEAEARAAQVRRLTEGRGADIVLELVGLPQVFAEGITLLRAGGTLVEIGNIWPNSNVTMDVSKTVWGNAQIISIAHYDPYVLPTALDFLVATAEKYPLNALMSHSFPLEDIAEAFEQSDWAAKEGNAAITRAFVTP